METLPEELVLKICNYLSTFDVIQFAEEFPHFAYLLQDKEVIRKTDFNRTFPSYRIELHRFISQKMNLNYIKCLNVNCIYWVNASDWRTCIKKLKFLRELIAIDTKLGLQNADCEAYAHCGFLKKLGVTVNLDEIGKCPCLQQLNKLLLKSAPSKYRHEGQLNAFLRKLTKLEELWVIVETNVITAVTLSNIAHVAPLLKKYVIKTKLASPPFDLKHLGLRKVFERRMEWNEHIFEKVPDIKNFEELEFEEGSPLQTFMELHCELPCGVEDTKTIQLNINSIDQIFFKELNFLHGAHLCNERFTEAVIKVMESDGVLRLKRLALRTCYFAALEPKKPEEKGDEVVPLKKTRVGIQIEPKTHAFNEITEKLVCLEELELGICKIKGIYPEMGTAFTSLSNLRNLKKLTLQVTEFLDGKFLEEMMINCDKLNSLRIQCLVTNERFGINLCRSLKHANNLKHFCLEIVHLEIDLLFDALNSRKNHKLERVNIDVGFVERFRKEHLAAFVVYNPHLVFFMIHIKGYRMVSLKELQRTLDAFRKKNSGRIFFVRKGTENITGPCPIPYAHHDMLHCDSQISNIDIYQDF